jgi:hypothetical protein
MAAAQIILSGTLTITPAAVVGTTSSAGPFPVPSGTDQIPLCLQPQPKPSAVRCNGNRRIASVFGSFSAVSGIGATDNVTTCDTLLVTSDGPLQLQFTMQNLAGGSPIVSVVQINGTQLFQFPSGGYLTGLQAAGNANLEYLGSGPA